MNVLSAALLLLISCGAFAQGEGFNYETLSQRFVTSVKEAQVDADFLQIQEVQDCVSQNPVTNVEDKTKIQEAQRNAANCLRAKFAAVDEGKLTELSKKLELDAYGVVKGKSNQALVDYLSGRLEKALYGAEGGNVVRLRDQKLVDQKVFVDIYETQLGKNILLEVSNYCFSRLDIENTPSGSRLKTLADLNAQSDNDMKANIINQGFKDMTPVGNAITDASNIYDNIKNELEQVTRGLDAQAAAAKLNNLFMVCVTAIPKMCENYEDCLCKYKQSKPQEFPNTPACNPNAVYKCSSVPTTMPDRGSHSCHVSARLRGYRTNLTAVKATQDRFTQDYGNVAGTQVFRDKESYDKGAAGPNESVDDLTSMTTSEVDAAFKTSEMAAETDAIPDDCAAKPEEPECAKFYYKGSEVEKFAQSSAGFSAATLLESEKINRLATKDDELKAYLNGRGYFDLEAQVGQGNSADIVAAARSRFEAEREATFTEMTNAFERKQFTTELNDNKQERANQVKQEYQNKGKEFQQLLLFNNVVSSYLDLRRMGDNGELESAGKNLRAFEREVRTAQNQEGSEGALEYFSQINSGEESQLSDSDTPLVNIDFLDQILGKAAPTPGEPN